MRQVASRLCAPKPCEIAALLTSPLQRAKQHTITHPYPTNRSPHKQAFLVQVIGLHCPYGHCSMMHHAHSTGSCGTLPPSGRWAAMPSLAGESAPCLGLSAIGAETLSAFFSLPFFTVTLTGHKQEEEGACRLSVGGRGRGFHRHVGLGWQEDWSWKACGV